MDDRELEARLTTHLHRRFDGARPPAQLVAGIELALATETRRVTRPTMRIGVPSFGWTAVAAAVLIAVVAVAGARFHSDFGPGASSPTPVSKFVPSTKREFLVLPPTAVIPSKADGITAVDVLSARLRALGILTFSSSAAFGIEFEVPVAGPTSEQIRRVLGANDVEFVPLPKADYDDAGVTAEAGKPLPVDEPALFGWEGVASATPGTNQQGQPTVVLVLTPAAAATFGEYTKTHSGETVAIVIDGQVAMLPIVREPITGGEVELSAGLDEGDIAAAVAILVGGRMPEAWRNPYVPVVGSEASILAQIHDLDKLNPVDSMDLQAMRIDGHWRAVWHVQLSGNISIYVDAETAQVIP